MSCCSVLCERTDGAATAATSADRDDFCRQQRAERSAAIEQKEDEKTPNDLLESAAAATEPAISTNSVLGFTGASRVSRHAWTHTNPGHYA